MLPKAHCEVLPKPRDTEYGSRLMQQTGHTLSSPENPKSYHNKLEKFALKRKDVGGRQKLVEGVCQVEVGDILDTSHF